MNLRRICICMLSLFVLMTAAASAQPAEQITYQMRDNSFKIDCAEGTYPSVTKADSILAKIKINTEIEKTVSNFIEDIKDRRAKGEDLTGWVSYEMKSAVWDQVAIDSRAGSYTQFTTRANEDGMFSVVLYLSTMYKGAAHPSTYARALTFDKDGNLVIWEEMLTLDRASGKNALTLANLRREAELQAGDKLYTDENLRDEIKAFPREFFVDDAGSVHALFQQYEIAPYAAGFIDVVYINR